MTMLCAAGRGPVTREECLSCALRGENDCGFDYTLLKYLWSTREDRSGEVHVTDLTGCLKKAYFSKTERPVIFPHTYLIPAMGKAIHAALEDEPNGVLYEVPVEAFGLVGRVDILYRKGVIVDFKTARRVYTPRLPYGSHALQVNIYALMVNDMIERGELTGVEPVSEAYIQYIDLAGPTQCPQCKAFPVPETDGIYCPVCGIRIHGHLGAVRVPVALEPEYTMELVKERMGVLKLALEMGDPPEAEPGFLCRYCPYVNLCPEGKETL